MIINSAKQIVCLLPLGKGSDLVQRLKDDKGIITSNFSHARGAMKKNSQFDFFPKETDIVMVIVEESKANDIFEYIYHAIKVEETPGSFMYQAHISGGSEFSLPELT